MALVTWFGKGEWIEAIRSCVRLLLWLCPESALR
jgi:hypothetical protein